MLKFAREPVIFIAVGDDFFFLGGGGNRHLTASEGGGYHNNITEPSGGSGKFYHDMTKILRPPLP